MQIPPKERHNAAQCIELGESGEVMPLIGIDLDLVRNVVLFQNGFQFFRFRYRHDGVAIAMQDQDWRKFTRILDEMLRESAKELGHGGNALLLSGESERKESAKRKTEQANALEINTRLRNNKADGIPERFQPRDEEIPDVGGRDPGVSSAIEVMDHKNVHTHSCGLLAERIDNAQRAA